MTSSESAGLKTNVDMVDSKYEYAALSTSQFNTSKEGYSPESGFKNSQPYKKDPIRAYCTVLGGFLYMMLPGTVYCTGVFSTYI